MKVFIFVSAMAVFFLAHLAVGFAADMTAKQSRQIEQDCVTTDPMVKQACTRWILTSHKPLSDFFGHPCYAGMSQVKQSALEYRKDTPHEMSDSAFKWASKQMIYEALMKCATMMAGLKLQVAQAFAQINYLRIVVLQNAAYYVNLYPNINIYAVHPRYKVVSHYRGERLVTEVGNWINFCRVNHNITLSESWVTNVLRRVNHNHSVGLNLINTPCSNMNVRVDHYFHLPAIPNVGVPGVPGVALPGVPGVRLPRALGVPGVGLPGALGVPGVGLPGALGVPGVGLPNAPGVVTPSSPGAVNPAVPGGVDGLFNGLGRIKPTD